MSRRALAWFPKLATAVFVLLETCQLLFEHIKVSNSSQAGFRTQTRRVSKPKPGGSQNPNPAGLKTQTRRVWKCKPPCFTVFSVGFRVSKPKPGGSQNPNPAGLKSQTRSKHRKTRGFAFPNPAGLKTQTRRGFGFQIPNSDKTQ
jgi:hypothetical protein